MNETSVWSVQQDVDDLLGEERSSTPLYPSVAQRIHEWTSLSSADQTRLKALSFNDNNSTSSSLSQESTSPKRQAFTSTSSPPMHASSSSLHHSNNNSNVFDGVANARYAQTEILLPGVFYSNSCSNDQQHLSSKSANLQMLIAELDASRDLNKKLSIQLAKTERDLQSYKIEQDLHNDKLDAIVASRVSEILNRLCGDSDFVMVKQTASAPMSSTPSPPIMETFDYVSDQEVKRLLLQLNKPNLTADEIANNCNSMLSYVKSKNGDCRVTLRNNDHEESLRKFVEEKNAFERQIELLNDEMKSLQIENATLKSRSEEKTNANLRERNDLHDTIAQLKYDNDKLKTNLAEANKRAAKNVDVLKVESEKAELQRQLEREQTEKQELFLQVGFMSGKNNVGGGDQGESERLRIDNQQLIAELGEVRANLDAKLKVAKVLESEVEKLKAENEQVKVENGQLARECDAFGRSFEVEMGKAQKERQRLLDELQQAATRREDGEKLNEANDKLKAEQDKNTEVRGKFKEAQEALEREREKGERLKEKCEQQEAKWQREVYELRRRFQEADEEKFQLLEEAKILRRELEAEKERKLEEITSKSEEPKGKTEEEQVEKLLMEKKQMEAKNEELKRLVTVLRRKLGSLTTN